MYSQIQFLYLIFILKDDWCENALNLTSGKLSISKDWPSGTYCRWLITSENDNSYITLEFQHLNVCNINYNRLHLHF